IALGMIIVIGWSEWKSNKVATTNAPANRVANVPPVANNPPPPAAFVNLPQEVRDTKVATLDGDSLKLSDFADKVVIVNIWATWCGPCRLEMQDLVRLSNEYRERGVVVLGLATRYNGRQVHAHVEEYVRSEDDLLSVLGVDGNVVALL